MRIEVHGGMTSAPTDPRIVIALAELERRLAEPLTVAALAASANLSPSRFAHLFRGALGVAPMRYLQSLRMERAGLLLSRTSLSVTDVMKRVGYANPNHFRRDFRRHHASAPREWRVACDRAMHPGQFLAWDR